jgi:hypothetical protein
MMAETPRRYAEGTEVTAEKSRAELETLLRKHGATEIGVYTSDERTIFLYRLRERMVRHTVEMPALVASKVPSYAAESQKRKAAEKAHRDRDAEWRRRWRALVLVVKAKLEIIASGGSTFEREFLADVMLPNGETVGEAMIPRIAEAYVTGGMPPFLLGPGDKP